MLTKPCWLALQAEALHLADTAAEAFEANERGRGQEIARILSIRQRPLSG
jgi:hypothetical protein